jgi:hypothetical protein
MKPAIDQRNGGHPEQKEKQQRFRSNHVAKPADSNYFLSTPLSHYLIPRFFLPMCDLSSGLEECFSFFAYFFPTLSRFFALFVLFLLMIEF